METKENETRNRIEIISLRAQTHKLKERNTMLTMVSVFCIVVACVSFFAYTNACSEMIDLNNRIDQLECDAVTEDLNNDGMKKEYEEMVAYTKECETTISLLYTIAETVVEQNEELVISNNDYYEKLLAYQEREELFDRYEYCLVREDGTRTDITYEQLENTEDLCEELGVDVDLVFSIVMVETRGDEDATSSISTARGYGQFLETSGEYVYEEIMGWGEYNHDYAYNGDTNLTMMVYYLNYLYKLHGNDLYAVIKNYRGLGGTTLYNYIYKIDQYLSYSGKSVSYLDSILV